MTGTFLSVVLPRTLFASGAQTEVPAGHYAGFLNLSVVKEQR
jgi:hypothetical protein